MEFKKFKDSINLDNKFMLIFLILNGFTGLLFLSFVAGTGILKLIFSTFFIFFILTIINAIWTGYAISNLALKRKVEKKDLFNIYVLIPIFAISFMGQVGNSEAFSVIFGEVGREIYNLYIITIHLFMLYKIFKNIKKGA